MEQTVVVMRTTLNGMRGAILRNNEFVDSFVNADVNAVLQIVSGVITPASEYFGDTITITINTEKNTNG